MSERQHCEFFLVRYVPDPVKDEFVNIGVVLLDTANRAEVRFARDLRRVRCLDPGVDLEMLSALESDVRAKLAESGDREKLLRSMNEDFSGAIQVSAPRACLTESAQQEIESLAALYLESPRRDSSREVGGRQQIFMRMRGAFEQAGVWRLMRKRISVAEYTASGDPLKLDCGYQPNGVVRLFHAVSLATDVDTAKVLAFSFPELVAGMARQDKAKAELTAVVEEDVDFEDDAVKFALRTLEFGQIRVARESELPRLAETARQELHV